MNAIIIAEFRVCTGRSRVFFIARDIFWLTDASWETGSSALTAAQRVHQTMGMEAISEEKSKVESI